MEGELPRNGQNLLDGANNQESTAEVTHADGAEAADVANHVRSDGPTPTDEQNGCLPEVVPKKVIHVCALAYMDVCFVKLASWTQIRVKSGERTILQLYDHVSKYKKFRFLDARFAFAIISDSTDFVSSGSQEVSGDVTMSSVLGGGCDHIAIATTHTFYKKQDPCTRMRRRYPMTSMHFAVQRESDDGYICVIPWTEMTLQDSELSVRNLYDTLRHRFSFRLMNVYKHSKSVISERDEFPSADCVEIEDEKKLEALVMAGWNRLTFIVTDPGNNIDIGITPRDGFIKGAFSIFSQLSLFLSAQTYDRDAGYKTLVPFVRQNIYAHSMDKPLWELYISFRESHGASWGYVCCSCILSKGGDLSAVDSHEVKSNVTLREVREKKCDHVTFIVDFDWTGSYQFTGEQVYGGGCTIL